MGFPRRQTQTTHRAKPLENQMVTTSQTVSGTILLSIISGWTAKTLLTLAEVGLDLQPAKQSQCKTHRAMSSKLFGRTLALNNPTVVRVHVAKRGIECREQRNRMTVQGADHAGKCKWVRSQDVRGLLVFQPLSPSSVGLIAGLCISVEGPANFVLHLLVTLEVWIAHVKRQAQQCHRTRTRVLQSRENIMHWQASRQCAATRTCNSDSQARATMK